MTGHYLMDQFPALKQSEALPHPIRQFEEWFQVLPSHGVSEQDAISMTLATADENGRPSARIVLLKSFDDRGFVFYTNYQSHKGKEISENSQVCLLFYWHAVWRQVRIQGFAEKVSSSESDQYFDTRPLGSKIGAWASAQSETVKDREELEQKFEEYSLKYGDKVPRPPHWGGYRVRPTTIEFWQGRDNRLHDRLRYRLQDDGSWLIERLAP
jgi:pyridoxamine 5'-phosphate oxidase